MTRPHGNAVFISADNTVLHVGSVDRILSHLGVTAANANDLRARVPEIYDDGANLLTIVRSADDAVTLEREGEPEDADEQLLIDRIALALAFMQVQLHGNVDLQLRSFRFPSVQGSLPIVLAALAEAFSIPDNDNDPGGVSHDASTHPHFR